MDVIVQVVKDIIELKIESDNIPTGITLQKLFEWYEWALTHGIIEVSYKYGELQGYIVWLRLNKLPKSINNIESCIDKNNSESILYINDSCVRDDGIRHGTILKLIYNIIEKNKHLKTLCWHEDSDKLCVLNKDNINKTNIEIRNLTKEEFQDLLYNSEDGDDFLEYGNPYEFFIKASDSFGIVINNLPIYAGCVIDSNIGKVTESMLRDGCREKYAYTLYKVAKKKALEWADKYGALRCYMNLDGSELSNLVYRWIEKMGYAKESFVNGRQIMVLNKQTIK